MDRTRSRRITINAYGSDADALRRLTSLLPGMPLNRLALRALRAGLPVVEAELRDAAQKLVDEGGV